MAINERDQILAIICDKRLNEKMHTEEIAKYPDERGFKRSYGMPLNGKAVSNLIAAYNRKNPKKKLPRVKRRIARSAETIAQTTEPKRQTGESEWSRVVGTITNIADLSVKEKSRMLTIYLEKYCK